MFNVISFVNNNSSETKSIITYIVCLFKFFISSRIRKLYMTSNFSFSNLILWMPRGGPHYSSLFFCFKNNFLLIEYLIRWDIYFVRSFSRVLCNLWENFNQLFNRSCFWFFFVVDVRLYTLYMTYNIIYMKKKSIKVGNKRYCKTNNFMGVCVRKLPKLWENVCACARPP